MANNDSAANGEVRITRRFTGLPQRLGLTQIELRDGLRVCVEERDGGEKYCIHFPVLSSFRLTDEGLLDKLLSKIWYGDQDKHALMEVENGTLLKWISDQSAVGLPARARSFILVCADEIIEVVSRDEPVITRVGSEVC